ncbi:hypothetical protein DSECCO2_236840 [anaerobic digester metagenome]
MPTNTSPAAQSSRAGVLYGAARLHGNPSPAHYDKTTRHFLHSKADIAAADILQKHKKIALIKKKSWMRNHMKIITFTI